MATYRGSEAIDYNKLNARTNSGSAAPKIVQLPLGDPQQQIKPKVVKKTRKQLRAETKRANLRAIKALTIATILLCFIGVIIYSRVELDEISRSISDTQSKLSVVESENTALEMKLNSMVSLDKVEEYAQDKLGMVKQEGYQVEYVDLTGSDKVLVSGGKQVDKEKEKETISK